MDRDPVGGRWSDGASWPLSLGTGGLRRGPASSFPVSGTHGPLPREGLVETPLGVGRVQEWGVKETGGRCRGRLSAPPPPTPRSCCSNPDTTCTPALFSCLLPFNMKKYKSHNEQSPSHIPAPGWSLPFSGSRIPGSG